MTEHNYSDTAQSMNKPNNIVQKTLVLQDSNITTQSNNASSSIVKKLTRAEMAEKRLKGLYYNCDEPFILDHQSGYYVSRLNATQNNKKRPTSQIYPHFKLEYNLEDQDGSNVMGAFVQHKYRR